VSGRPLDIAALGLSVQPTNRHRGRAHCNRLHSARESFTHKPFSAWQRAPT